MPRFYRAMTVDGDGRPKIGPTARTLGVRVGEGEYDDVAADENQDVHPGAGGMSVAPSWRDLETHRIPKRLQSIMPDATGSNRDACWRMGDGEFENASVTDNLALICDSLTHGELQPIRSMNVDAFQQALADTRDEWEIDEE